MTNDARKKIAGVYPATGFLRCPGGTGSGNLAGSQLTVVTAAHVVIGSSGGSCTFTIAGPSGLLTVPVDMARMRAGSSNPRSEPAARDWAVVRLRDPIAGVRPYSIGGTPNVGAAMKLVSGRTLTQGGVTVEPCSAKAMLPGPEIAMDCSAQSGDSGAAVLSASGSLNGIYVGFRSAAPSQAAAFSTSHYNFAIPISAAIRAAIAEVSR